MTAGRTAVLLGLVLVAVFVCYESVLDGPAIFDDGFLFEDPTDWPAEPNRILTNSTFALNFSSFGEETFSFHVVSLVLHGLAVLACCWFLRELLLLAGQRRETATRIALLAATLFALSPIQTAAVSYIWQRATVLAGLLCLTSLALFCAGLRRRGHAAGWRIGLAILYVPLAVLAKQNAVMLVPLMLGLVALFRRPVRRPAIAVGSAVAILAVSVVMLSLFWWGKPLPFDTLSGGYDGRSFTLTERLLTQPRVVLSLLASVVLPLPARLNLDHHVIASTGLLNPQTTLPAILAVLAILATGLALAGRRPLAALAVLWFPVLLVPESTIVPLELKFDHRAYLPSVGVFLLVAAGLRSLTVRYPVRGGVAVASLLVALAVLTMTRNEVWTSRTKMWEDAVAKSPEKARPHFNLALAYRDSGQVEPAFREFNRSLVLAPRNVDYATALNAFILEHEVAAGFRRTVFFHVDSGRYSHAEELLLLLIAQAPGMADLHVDLACVYAASGGTDAAVRALTEAVRLGYRNLERLRTDPFLARVRKDRRFAKLIENAK